jgi:uncharacterized protein (DUF2225 family)
MTTIDEVSFTCPVDGEVFADSVVMSTNQMGSHTDFKPVVGGLFPFPFYVHACPRCGFAGTEEDFAAGYDEKFKKWVKSELCGELEAGELYGGLKYVLAARCAERLGRPGREVADLYLRGAWCAQEEETPGLEARCRREAAARFEQALHAGGIDAGERAAITYLVGELQRRLGNAQEAALWFDRVDKEIVDPDEQAWIARAAVMQKQNPVDVFPEDLAQ